MKKYSEKFINESRLLFEEYNTNWPNPGIDYSTFKLKKIILGLFAGEVNRLRRKKIYVLDLGCGFGRDLFELNAHFKGRNIVFHGIDLRDSAVAFCEYRAKKFNFENFKFWQSDVEKATSEVRYDIIISSDVIEHVPHPRRMIKAAYNLLKEDGIFILATPNKVNSFKKLYSKLPFIGKLREEGKYHHDESVVREIGEHKHEGTDYYLGKEHISEMVLSELTSHLESAGFIIEKKAKGTVFGGGKFVDEHQFLFSALLAADLFFDLLRAYSWSTNLIIQSRKPKV